MDRALQQRPAARQPAQAGPARHAPAAAGARTAIQLSLAEGINAGPSVERLMILGRVLNGASAEVEAIPRSPPTAVVQRASDDEEEVPNVLAEEAPEQEQPPPQPLPPGPLLSDIDYSSRRANAPVSERSIYFRDGTRLRLDHPKGPTIKSDPLVRYTFKEKPGSTPQNPQYYDKRDYRTLRKAPREGPLDVSQILKPAQMGDPGKLFEIDPENAARTHPSRGRPVAEEDIQLQQHLDLLFEIAKAADAARGNPDFDPEVYNQLIRETFEEEEEEEEEQEQEQEDAPPDARKRKGMDEPDEEDEDDDDDEPRRKLQKLPDEDDDRD